MSEEFIDALYRSWQLKNPQKTFAEECLGRQAFTEGVRRGIRINYTDNAVNYSVSEYPVQLDNSYNLILRTKVRIMPQLLDMFHENELNMNKLRYAYRMEKGGSQHMVDLIMRERHDSLNMLLRHDNMKELRATSEANAVRKLNDPDCEGPTLIQLLNSEYS